MKVKRKRMSLRQASFGKLRTGRINSHRMSNIECGAASVGMTMSHRALGHQKPVTSNPLRTTEAPEGGRLIELTYGIPREGYRGCQRRKDDELLQIGDPLEVVAEIRIPSVPVKEEASE